MKKFDTLCIGDMHLHDTYFKNKYYDEWLIKMYREMFDSIIQTIHENKINKVIFVGDIFDAPPKDRSLTLFHNFVKDLQIIGVKEIIAIDGNHEVISGNNSRVYYLDLMREYFEGIGVRVESYKKDKSTLYCGHGHIHKLERLTSTQKIIYTHFRSGITEVAADEIDVIPMQYKSDIIVTGDIHKRLAYDKIVYTGSPIDTSFSLSNTQADHTPSVLLFNEDTLDWKWETTLDVEYRKRKVVYPSVKKFLEEVQYLKEEANADKNFLKIVIQDKKHNLKKINKSEYEDFAMLEFIRVDLEVEKENKEIVSKIAENLSKANVSDNLLDFILQNNEHPEWIDKIKGVFATYEKGIK